MVRLRRFLPGVNEGAFFQKNRFALVPIVEERIVYADMSERPDNQSENVAAVQRLLKEFPPRTQARGRLLLGNGGVRQLYILDEGVHFGAKVQAHRVFDVTVVYDGQDWNGQCTCPAK